MTAVCVCAAAGINAQTLSQADKYRIGDLLTRIVERETTISRIKVERVSISDTTLTLYTNIDMSYYPFRVENIPPIYDSIRECLPDEMSRFRIRIITDRQDIEDLIPRPLRSKTPERKMPQRKSPDAEQEIYQDVEPKTDEKRFVNRASRPLVTRLSSLSQPERGLAGRHIAMWQSHGLYFDNNSGEWQWQRAKLWQTIEDLYTQSYVLQYLVPMLENAGANVMLPRERDWQTQEVIVDNDTPGTSTYDEYTGHRTWYTPVERGFALRQQTFTDGQNPFTDGSCRASECVSLDPEKEDESRIVWTPDIPEKGRYAVYVSYQSHRNSADDARYTVRHLGGETTFAVNQMIGGGTWIYLGHFDFAEGMDEAHGSVTLTNRSAHGRHRIVTADAVRFGGGYGNIARIPVPEKRNPEMEYEPTVSGYPRYVEGARYWLQWAGFPEKVYNPKQGADDYRDDYMSRAHWVNYLMGGSKALPDSTGLRIPVDMAFAFHSDAGAKMDDEIVGTLGIFFTRENNGKYHGGASRYLSRDLADMVMSNICRDVRAAYEPEWSRRGLWNRSYYEARVPSAPTMLLELLSHQNFADMRYGLDPRFRFTVSRAVYKGILQYLAYQYDQEYVVQPLPVEAFAAALTGDSVRLSWRPRIDTLEESARAERYIIYTRRGDAGFDNGRMVDDTACIIPISRDTVYSFRVTAVNDGGESFPSQTLAVCRLSQEKGTVMIVNGFDRVSAPLNFQGDSIAGFFNHIDGGVPYLNDISFIGYQREYRRSETMSENYNESLGSCYSDYAAQVLAGNTFDYPALHGRSIAAAGYSFCSASAQAVEADTTLMTHYPIIDLILGKQRSTVMGRGTGGIQFRTFTPELQRAITHYTSTGGNIMVSGSYVGSDLSHGPDACPADQTFAREVLHYRLVGQRAARRGTVKTKRSPARFPMAEYRFNTELSSECYAVESPDAIAPVGKGAYTILCYSENGLGAGTAFRGDYKTIVLGFPFETVTDQQKRDRLMKDALDFFDGRE